MKNMKSEEIKNNNNEVKEEIKEKDSPPVDQNHILSYLKRNEELSEKMLKSIRFIKRYYFWRSFFNFLKIALLVIVVVLGIISWDSIVDFFSNFSGNIEQTFYSALKEGIKENINLPN
jgi:hypothetical protein